MVQGPAECHHQIGDTRLPQTEAVFDEAIALDTPLDMLHPPPLVQRVVRHVLHPRELLAPGCLGRHADLALGQGERQEAQSLQQSAPGRHGRGRGLSEALLMDTAAVSRTEKAAGEGGIDPQDFVHRVVLFLAAIARFGLCV